MPLLIMKMKEMLMHL